MTAYYNEIDPFAAQWLRNLIAAGNIAPGEVDERDIRNVEANDLRKFTQCHFFAGIGVWSYALRMACWDDSRPVWTGSCPCQPFSSAGEGKGFADDRHLWPVFAELIKECRPAAVLGEQVASKDAEPWLDLVHADLESMGYAFGSIPFPSAGIGAPHIRDRLFWVADPDNSRLEGRIRVPERAAECAVGSSGVVSRLAYAANSGSGEEWQRSIREQRLYKEDRRSARNALDCQWTSEETSDTDLPGPTNGLWRAADWLLCRDGKWRPVEPGTFPLADGIASSLGRVQPRVQRMASRNRVGRLRGYGNAINAEAARIFIECYLEFLESA